jgi:hypothetical protein
MGKGGESFPARYHWELEPGIMTSSEKMERLMMRLRLTLYESQSAIIFIIL